MKKLKKLTLSSNELGNAFDSLRLSDSDMASFTGGCFCSSHCISGPSCTSGWY